MDFDQESVARMAARLKPAEAAALLAMGDTWFDCVRAGVPQTLMRRLRALLLVKGDGADRIWSATNYGLAVQRALRDRA